MTGTKKNTSEKNRPFNSGLQKNVRSVLEENWPQILSSKRDAKGIMMPLGAPPVGRLFEQLEKNLSHEKDIFRSDKNWWFRKALDIDPHNESSEKVLEKSFAKYLDNWANQVPTCSGYSDGRDGKRSIDLVHKTGAGSFRFIELKTTSNNPLYATAEILLYGLTYILARMKLAARPKDLARLAKDQDDPVLMAKEIRLVVLAPEAFYSGYSGGVLSELERMVDAAVREFARGKNLGFTMCFGFEVLGAGFEKKKLSYTKAEIWEMAKTKALFPHSKS